MQPPFYLDSAVTPFGQDVFKRGVGLIQMCDLCMLTANTRKTQEAEAELTQAYAQLRNFIDKHFGNATRYFLREVLDNYAHASGYVTKAQSPDALGITDQLYAKFKNDLASAVISTFPVAHDYQVILQALLSTVPEDPETRRIHRALASSNHDSTQ